MNNIDKLYDDKFWCQIFFRQNAWFDVAKQLDYFLNPTSIIDVGAGLGYLLYWFAINKNIPVCGLEGSSIPLHISPIKKYLYFVDLTKNLPDNFKIQEYDLTISTEVAEHIDKEFEENFLKIITRTNQLFFSASNSKGGKHHVNLQPLDYWIKRIEEYGYISCPVLTKLFKDKLTKDVQPIKHIIDNCIIFQRENNV